MQLKVRTFIPVGELWYVVAKNYKLAGGGGSRSPVVDRVPGGGILFFLGFSKMKVLPR